VAAGHPGPRSAAKLPSGPPAGRFFGAISVEMMEIKDSVDDHELTPSKEKKEKTPINPMFNHPIGSEGRRSIH